MKFLYSLINTGISQEHDETDKAVIRKINIMFYVGYSFILFAFILENFAGLSYYNLNYYFILSAGLIIPLLVKYKKFLLAVYYYFIMAFIFFLLMTMMMGLESNVIYFYVMLFMCLNLLFTNAKYIRHLIYIYFISAFFLAVIAVFMIKDYNPLYISIPQPKATLLKNINTIIFFLTSFLMMYFLSYENYRMEKKLFNLIKLKEILLAEVYHRVKNNLNLITSMLNMQKNSTNNEEIKKALEECRSRVYSISLLHQKLIQPQTREVDITGYIMDICSEFRKSLPAEHKIMFELNLQPVRMKISQAIPLGLIINELMTNSYKHNSALNEIMKIQISLDTNKNKILFKYSDSGKTKNIKEGNSNNSEKNVTNKLGTVIIESLSEQLDAVLHSDVSDGYHLSMEIPLMN